MNPGDRSCTLCDLPVGDSPVTDDHSQPYCCIGCRDIFETLDELEGVSAMDFDGSPDQNRSDSAWADSIPPGHETVYLRVDGMHCSTCELFIESMVGGFESVDSTSASYVTDTVRVAYDPDRIDADTLISEMSRLGYRAYPRDDARARQRAADRTRLRLGVGLLFGAFVMFSYMMLIYPTYLGAGILGHAVIELLQEGLYDGAAHYLFIGVGGMTSVVLFYTGWPILRGAYVSLSVRSPNMDLLIAIAAMSAYFYSWLEIYTGGTHIYFDVSVAIIMVVTVGGYYENQLKEKAVGELTSISAASIDSASVLAPDGTVRDVTPDEVEPGSRVLIRAGDRIPVDGRIVEGSCTTDESIVTGESLPVRKAVGDTVIGGSVVRDGYGIVEVGSNPASSLDRVSDLVWDLQSSTHGIQKLADRLATIFVPAVLVAAIVITAIYLGPVNAAVPTALLVGLTVLIVSCPCALGVATPLAVAAGVRDGLRVGIVVFDETVFERLSGVDVAIFDKTGTLTHGEMSVITSTAPDRSNRMAAVLERRSGHPVAEAIVAAFEPAGGDGRSPRPDGGVPDRAVGRASAADTSEGASVGEYEVADFTDHSNGVSGTVDGDRVLVGHPDLFDRLDWAVPGSVRETFERHLDRARIPVLVGHNGTASGVIVVGDRPRDEWEVAVETLADRGISIVVLTGDDERAADYLESNPNVEHVFAGVPPEAKAETVRSFGDRGRTVMIGDGTNDAPALASADLGIAVGGATAMATDAADIAIVTDDLRTIDTVFELAASAGRRVKQNIGWAFMYNGIAIPLAVLGVLNPLYAALAMATSSLLVVTNSSRKLL